MPNINIVCETCGSADVLRDAWAAWNPEKQEWELAHHFDDAFCENCEGPTHLKEVSLKGFDNRQAMSEGWAVSEVSGLADVKETYRLERIDEQEIFIDDAEAWIYVAARALNGSQYHKQALQFIATHSSMEFERIQNQIAHVNLSNQLDLK